MVANPECCNQACSMGCRGLSPGEGNALRAMCKSGILSVGVETRISAAGNRLAPEAC
jgi:hypothetical protein